VLDEAPIELIRKGNVSTIVSLEPSAISNHVPRI
jgi:hypothetical protein